MPVYLPKVVLQSLAVILAFGAAWVVAQRGSGDRSSRTLAALFLVEGLTQLAWGAVMFAGDTRTENLFAVAGITLLAVTGWIYLRLLRFLDTPLAKPLAARPAAIVIGAILILPGVVLAAMSWGELAIAPYYEEGSPASGVVFLPGILFALVLVYATVASWSAWLRAPKATPARAKGLAFAGAFGVRDGVYLLALLVTIVILPRMGVDPNNPQVDLLWVVAPLLYIPLLAWGILRLQVFDIDLKVKGGIKRGSVIAFGIVVVFVALKAAEFYLSKQVGFLAGALAAGLVLFVAPRLNRVADKVADKAAPNVKPTSEYMSYRKLEVYRAALESALEEGAIDGKQRAILDRLRAKLGLPAEAAAQMEQDLAA